MAARIQQQRADLEAQLAEQLGFIRRSAASYDAGDDSEAKRLAVSVRVLVHDYKSSRSLLGQLGLKRIGFFDTAHDISPTNLVTEWGLVSMAVGSGDGATREGFVAPLDRSSRGEGVPVAFASWWNKSVFRDTERQELTRKDIVLAIANQDGGAHVDPALEARYAKLSRHNSLGWMSVTGEGEKPLPGPHLAAMRQIAHEVLKSVERRVPPQRVAGHVARRAPAPVGRNDPCPCGSGRKFKKCCGP